MFSIHSPEVFFEYFSEMETVNGKGYCHWQEFRFPEEGPEDKSPVVEALLSEQSQYKDRL